MKSEIMAGVFGLAVLVAAAANSWAQAASAPAAAPAGFVQKLNAGKPQKIVYFGTSLTEYGAWVQQFSAVLEKNYPHLVTTFNGGKSGQNSDWGQRNVQANVIDQNPDVVFIEFSTNDAVDRFHISVADARKNWETIIDRIQAARPECEIILQVMNPVLPFPPGHGSRRSDLPAYQQMVRDLGRDRKLRVLDHVPAWQTLLDQGEAEYRKFVPDGLHPGGPGYEKYMLPTMLRELGIPKMK